MAKTLYILTNTVQKDHDDFSIYIQHDQDGHFSSYVFIQDGLAQQDQIGEEMYSIQDNEKFPDKHSTLNPISYRELLGLIFVSDTVMVM